MEMNRRTLAKGAAWAAPVVVASAAVPAYAASQEPCKTGNFTAPAPTDENGKTTTWTVPAGVNSICFTVLGGAGGGFGATPGGAGAQVTGTLPVKPGDTLTLVVGSGGVSNQASWGRTFGTAPATGGKGYGDGGDTAKDVTGVANVTRGKEVVFQRFSGSGGAGSAILLNGQPVVIAGGGGGAAVTPTLAALHETSSGGLWRGAQIAPDNSVFASTNTSQQQAGNAGGSAADATGVTTRTTTNKAAVAGETVTFGSGAKAGVAGVGGVSGADDGRYTGTAMNVEETAYSAGGNGESVAAPGAAKGGTGVALDKTQIVYMKDGGEGAAHDRLTARLVVSGGGGGGGYGGGAAGSGKFYALVWNGTNINEINPTNKDIWEHGATVAVGNPGAAGGSYFASSIADGAITQGSNANSTGGTRNHGAISFSF